VTTMCIAHLTDEDHTAWRLACARYEVALSGHPGMSPDEAAAWIVGYWLENKRLLEDYADEIGDLDPIKVAISPMSGRILEDDD
jgi:hypothetical protein